MEIISDFLRPYIFIGSEGILIESVKNVYRWESTVIELRAGDKRITIHGRKLSPEHKTNDMLLIKGTVEAIELGRRRE